MRNRRQKFFTVSDAGRKVHRSAAAIRAAENDGRLRADAYTVGGIRLFLPSTIDRFARTLATTPPERRTARGSMSKPSEIEDAGLR
jgi:hypothetical protein